MQLLTHLEKQIITAKKQYAWILAPLRTCPKFEASFWAKVLGDRTPYIQTEKLVGGCE